MKKQKDTFVSFEGDAWYERNKNAIHEDKFDPIVNCIGDLHLLPKKILEIGCSNGYRLNELNKIYGAECFGVDPSSKAVKEGGSEFPKITLSQGTADFLKFNDGEFDLVIVGFCLYLCDRNDLFKIACEIDRVLSDKGSLIILDFGPPFPYKNIYKYTENVFSFKMNYSSLFNWNPNYFTVYSKMFTHSDSLSIFNPDERVVLSVLLKDADSGYPNNPFQAI